MNDISRARDEFFAAADKFPEMLKRQTRSASRRGFLTAGVGLGAAGALAACGTTKTNSPAAKPAGSAGSAAGATPEGKEATDKSATEKVLNFSNWVSYIDVDDKDANKHPTLVDFETQTGIHVNYTEDVNSNDDFYAKIHQQLASGQDTGRDLAVLSDWLIGKMRQLGYLEVLNQANIPNFGNMAPQSANPAYDPQRKHTIPWAQGFTLIGVNLKSSGLSKQQAENMSIKDMLTNGAYKGKVGYFAEMEDGVGFAMLALGFDPANFTEDQFQQAVSYVQKAKDANQIRTFTGNDYLADLQSGNFAVCMAYSGDVAQLGDDNVVWCVPQEGMMWFADNMCIPAMAAHKTNAEKFMNYMLDPKIAARLDDYISYVPVVSGADTAMQDIDKAALTNQLIFPDAATKSKAHEFKSLDLATLDKYVSAFKDVTG